MYQLLRRFLFLFDAEKVHYFSMNALRVLCKWPLAKGLLGNMFRPAGDHQFRFMNIHFPNRVGLGAGFDKNARYLTELQTLGFGHVEIGTVTPKPQDGNDKPRLFRLPKDKALINRMGFNNDGMEAIAARLKQWRLTSTINRKSATGSNQIDQTLIIGGNIGKNKATANEDAWKDYEACFLALHEWVDYFVVNVSSPNTPGLRELQEKESLRKIFSTLHQRNKELQNPKPILLKIAPDLSREQVDDVIDLAMEINLDGLIVSNTTISREQLKTNAAEINTIGAGGLSGQPVKEKSTALIAYIHQKTAGKLAIIGSGGIFTGADAKEKIDAGASLVQVWTGFIYEGPAIVKRISTYLAAVIK